MKPRFLLMIFVGALVASCSWGPGSNMDETRDQILTIARKADAVDFSKFSSYAITDSITVVKDGFKSRLSNDTTDLIIAEVVRNMNANGYTQVDADGNPDLLVDIAYIQKANTYMYPGYWNDWDWWWNYNYYPWFGWGSYYPYQTWFITSYTTGSLVIEVADVVNVATEQNVPVVWHGLVREILNGRHTQQELLEAVNEVFTILPPK